ncbi:Rox1 protein [Saccharomycopsis crataegensis]|uniref:Rox1 protein n=1 Tax=Saccharomycopsis crataegensis TaxID=43959 RepID=A0AAV5QV86_9ASCO|nr:Rox1 protein [Saccharomycopsis crataegensis]
MQTMSYQNFPPEQKWSQEIRSPLNSYQIMPNQSTVGATPDLSNSASPTIKNEIAPHTTLPPLSQVMFDTNQTSQQGHHPQTMHQQPQPHLIISDGFATFHGGNGISAPPSSTGSLLSISSRPIIPEHDEKCPFRTDGQPRIPRPRNAFILFRQHHHQAVLDEGNLIKTNPDVSRELGKRWRALPAEEKEYWNKLAEEEKKKHSEKYPGYRYVPRRSGKKGNCPACKAKAALKNGGSVAAANHAAAAQIQHTNPAHQLSNPISAPMPAPIAFNSLMADPMGVSDPNVSGNPGFVAGPPDPNGFPQYHPMHQDIIYQVPMGGAISPHTRGVAGNPMAPGMQFMTNQMFSPIPPPPGQFAMVPSLSMAQQPHQRVQNPMQVENPQHSQHQQVSGLPPLSNNYMASNYDMFPGSSNVEHHDTNIQNSSNSNDGTQFSRENNSVSLPHIGHLDIPANVGQINR